MSRAKDLISLAEQFASKLSAVPANSISSDARRALTESSNFLGLDTPIVTKEIAGGNDVYFMELARQIAEFLVSGNDCILKREGGIIPLIDLFAIYNQARGIGTCFTNVGANGSFGESHGSGESVCYVS